MNSKQTLKLFASLIFAVVAALVHPLAHAQRTATFGYGLVENSNQGRAARFFAQQVEKESKGRVKINAVGNATLGSDVQMQAALTAGTQEMMVGSTATLAGLVREMALWDTPFLFSNSKEAYAVLDGPVGSKIMSKLPEKGMVGLVYWENGFRNLTNSKRPVSRMEDLGGVRLRVMQNPVYLESFKILGADAVPMPFSELFNALKANTVDGQENPYNTILSSKFYEVQKHLTVSNHVYSPWIVLVNKKFWDTLSSDDQAAVMRAAVASRDFERKDTQEEAKKALAQLKEKGMTVTELSPAEVGRMRDSLTKVNAAIAANIGMDLWNEAQAELKKIRGQK
jgi:tripartite ATP-independent transporter DctP family solute receptor